MARENISLELTDGETKLKFSIKPMSALKAEKWLYKAVAVLGLPVISEIKTLTAEGVIKALAAKPLDFDKAEPLLDELLACCKRQAGGGVEVELTPETIEGQIEFPTTLFLLRVAAFKASFGFFGGGGWQNFLAALSGVTNVQKSAA